MAKDNSWMDASIEKEQEREQINEIKRFAIEFVSRQASGEGYEKLKCFRNRLKSPQDKDMLLKEIHQYIVKKYPLAGTVSLLANPKEIERLLLEISVKDFIGQKYLDYPFLLKSQDFYKMVSCSKRKIVIRRFKEGATFKFVNNYISPTFLPGEKLKNIYNDVNFYLSEDKSMIFAKVVRQKFSVHNIKKYVEGFNHTYDEHDSQTARRGMTVAVYAFLQGKETQPCNFARLDDDGYVHRNLFIDDQREHFFGEFAGFPHFHFQNEVDQYICRKDNQRGYKTGRCNAIDIPHLLKYLEYIENLSSEQKDLMRAQEEDGGLPFFRLMTERETFFLNPLLVIDEFVNLQNEDGREMAKILFADFDKKYNGSQILGGLNYFKNFAFALLLIQHISDIYWENPQKNPLYKDFLAKFEIFLSDKIMDAVCNISEKKYLRENGMPYFVTSDYGNKFVNYPAID